MDKKREELLKKLKEVKKKAGYDLKNNHIGYENCTIKDVIHYNKKVELINKKTNQKEEFDLCVVVVEDLDTKEISRMCYLNGEEVDFSELMLKYESPEPIKDVVNRTKENEEKPENKQDKELKSEGLEQLEQEKLKEKDSKKKSDNEEVREKPKYIIQTVDVDQAYVDKLHTLRTKLRLPNEVKELAFAYPNTEEDKKLSDDLTVIMLDSKGRRIDETSSGKKITDVLTVDDSTGDNPMYDDNTKLELGGYAEKNKNMTMKRFKAKGINDNNFYLSVEQKEVGGYAEVYSGGRTHDGNDPVEVQLETDNVEIQTDLEMQEIIDGRRGIHNRDNIDLEADMHENHGDDTDKIKKENADGNRSTHEICELDIVPGTDKTWEQWAEELGDSKENLQERFEREMNKAPRKPENIVRDIEADYEMLNNHEHNRF